MIKAIVFDLDGTLLLDDPLHGRRCLFPETRRVLQALKERYRLAVITNVAPTTPADAVHDVLRAAGIHECFDVITVSSDVGSSKPAEAIFAGTLRRLAVTPDEAVMVGNTVATDIFGGNRSGMTTVLVQRETAYQPSEWERPHHTIQTIQELLDLFPAST